MECISLEFTSQSSCKEFPYLPERISMIHLVNILTTLIEGEFCSLNIEVNI